MTKSPEDVDPEKAPGIAAMQAIKFEEDDPIGWLLYLTPVIILLIKWLEKVDKLLIKVKSGNLSEYWW